MRGHKRRDSCPVRVHGPRVTVVQVRIGCGSMKADLTAIGPQATPENTSACRSSARCGLRLASIGRCDEWHVDLEKIITVEKLSSYPACTDSRKKPDLRAIRRCDRRAHAGRPYSRS